jgi:hypothetical protein
MPRKRKPEEKAAASAKQIAIAAGITDSTPNLRLRVKPEMLAKLEKARERYGRTLSGEIMHRLEQSFTDERNRATGFENAATILEMAAEALPHVPQAQLATYVGKLVQSLQRIASQLREGPLEREIFEYAAKPTEEN